MSFTILNFSIRLRLCQVRAIFVIMRSGSEKFKPTVTFEKISLRVCDHEGCQQQAEYRAPKSRERVKEYFWFCLAHVRAYNKAWNFYSGMNPNEIEIEIREDTVWRRPTWPMGSVENGKVWRRLNQAKLRDQFGIFNGQFSNRDDNTSGPQLGPETNEDRAFRILGLDPSASLSELKTKYKDLVKTHHPDRNGGDKTSEERLKDINDAYSTLRKSVTA